MGDLLPEDLALFLQVVQPLLDLLQEFAAWVVDVLIAQFDDDLREPADRPNRVDRIILSGRIGVSARHLFLP